METQENELVQISFKNLLIEIVRCSILKEKSNDDPDVFLHKKTGIPVSMIQKFLYGKNLETIKKEFSDKILRYLSVKKKLLKLLIMAGSVGKVSKNDYLIFEKLLEKNNGPKTKKISPAFTKEDLQYPKHSQAAVEFDWETDRFLLDEIIPLCSLDDTKKRIIRDLFKDKRVLAKNYTDMESWDNKFGLSLHVQIINRRLRKALQERKESTVSEFRITPLFATEGYAQKIYVFKKYLRQAPS